MMKADEPTMTHVALSYKIRKFVHTLRRYAWETRNVTQELRQDQHGVMPKVAIALLKSVEDNAENMVEVASAVLEECGGAADFYESFQEKVRERARGAPRLGLGGNLQEACVENADVFQETLSVIGKIPIESWPAERGAARR